MGLFSFEKTNTGSGAETWGWSARARATPAGTHGHGAGGAPAESQPPRGVGVVRSARSTPGFAAITLHLQKTKCWDGDVPSPPGQHRGTSARAPSPLGHQHSLATNTAQSAASQGQIQLALPQGGDPIPVPGSAGSDPAVPQRAMRPPPPSYPLPDPPSPPPPPPPSTLSQDQPRAILTTATLSPCAGSAVPAVAPGISFCGDPPSLRPPDATAALCPSARRRARGGHNQRVRKGSAERFPASVSPNPATPQHPSPLPGEPRRIQQSPVSTEGSLEVPPPRGRAGAEGGRREPAGGLLENKSV